MPHPIRGSARGARRGSELFLCRAARRLTQKSVAEAIGVSEATISYVERGLLWPRREILQDLATFYDVEFETVCRWVRESCEEAAREDQPPATADRTPQEATA